MSRHEEKAYRVGKGTKPTVSDMRSRLVQMRRDLENYATRKPAGTVAAALTQRIRELEAEIATAEADQEAGRQQRRDALEEGAGGAADRTGRGPLGAAPTSGRFPPRGRPGRG